MKYVYRRWGMDNRNFTRVNYSAGASVRYGIEVALCNTGNLSLHGMYLKTDHDIPLNAPVNVTLYHSSQEPLKVNAKVVRKEVTGVGLQINNLNVKSFVQLRNIVTEHSSDKGAVMQETFKMLKCIY
jgi:hypothetical protein